jgi:hypothetical protein
MTPVYTDFTFVSFFSLQLSQQMKEFYKKNVSGKMKFVDLFIAEVKLHSVYSVCPIQFKICKMTSN